MLSSFKKFVLFSIISTLFISCSVPETSESILKNNYSKQIVQIEMRDGIKLSTAIYSPKDNSVTYPIILLRTPYRIGNYNEGELGIRNFPTIDFLKSGYIFVMQDVRGKFMSEGKFDDMRAFVPDKKSDKDIDESSDTYDTIDWLIKNVKNNNGKVGQWGISYPGFYSAMALIESHPSLVVVSPQAPISDWFIGDDMHHNGAFSLNMAFNFFKGFGQPRPEPTQKWSESPKYDSPDAYNFFLKMGPIKNLNSKILKGRVDFWNLAMKHGNYDSFWQSRNNLPHFINVKPSVLTVGGWFDSEDFYGPLNIYNSIEEKNKNENLLVVGPWTHGGWFRTNGNRLATLDFGGNQSLFYQDSIWFPYFEYKLKGKKNPNLPEAYIFGTGENKWHRYDTYPPKNIEKTDFYLNPQGKIRITRDLLPKIGFKSFVSDPNNPVPYTANFHDSRKFYNKKYMAEDQRFASSRPDVITFETDKLSSDLTLVGPIMADLYVSTTGTDADWVVKIVDVFPDSAKNLDPNPDNIEMGGVQALIRYEIMRGKYRNSYEKPEPFIPGKVTEVKFKLNDIHHTFKAGHKLMVQIQSSLFPFFDRNPQTFCDIYNCDEKDFIKATHKVFFSKKYSSKITMNVLSK